MTNIRKTAPRQFELTWSWQPELKLLLDWNLIVSKHSLEGQKGVCIHWQARPKSEVFLGFGKRNQNRFGRSWGVYTVHTDDYLSPPDLGNSNKGIQIPEFWCTSCSPIDVPEEFANGINPVAVLWFPGLQARMENKNILISKIK